MANELVERRWIIDTASGTAVTSEKMFVKHVRWVYEGASAGDNCVIQDKNGKKLWESSAAGANHIDAHNINDWWNGILVPTLAGGTLIIQLL